MNIWNAARAEWQAKTAPVIAAARQFAERFRHFSANNLKLAEYHLAQGNYPDAVLRFRLVLWQEPKNVGAWVGLAEALVHSDRKARARAALQKALALLPDNPRAQAVLAALNAPKP